MMTFWTRALVPCATLCMALSVACGARAAEGFQVRYSLAGVLGADMFAPTAQEGGWLARLSYFDARVHKVTGGDGRGLTLPAAGGVVPLPAPASPALYPTYGASTVQVNAAGTLRQWNLALIHLSRQQWAGGRLVFGLNLPYGTRRQAYQPRSATPSLQWHPAVPAPTRAAVAANFDHQYQSMLAAQAAAESGEAAAIGDVDLQAAWVLTGERLRTVVGASLVLPTGKYDPGSGVDIGLGNFYTLRPFLQAGWRVARDVELASRLTLGLNSRNRDNNVRSGNWVGLETAAGYRLPVGVIGLQLVHIRQVQDDVGNRFGASRLRTSNAGLFFTTRVPVIGATLTLQHAASVSSRYATHGRFTQLRLIRAF